MNDFVPDTQPIIVMDKEDSFELSSDQHRKRILEIKDDIAKHSFELCKLLGIAREKERYKSWGYATYKEYAHRELGVHYGKARYMADLWLRIGKPNPKLLQTISDQGWDKAKQLVNVITEENAETWVEKAKHLNADELKKEVKAHLLSMVPDDPNEALQKEGEVKGTPVEQVQKHMSFSFTHEQYMALAQALAHVQKVHPDIQSKSECLSLICADYLGSNVGEEEGIELTISMMKKFESVLPIRFVVVNTETKEIVYGKNKEI